MASIDPKDRLIVALDAGSHGRMESLVGALAGEVRTYKIGLELFTSVGPEVVSSLRDKGMSVFLDLKLHDIPRTVERAAAAVARLGASMTTVHALAGPDAVAAAREGIESAAGPGPGRPLLLAVTLLTSHREEDLKALFPGDWDIEEKVLELAVSASRSGADGIVCSPLEVAAVKSACPDVVAVTPGVRMGEVEGDDQRRTASPAGAVAGGADYLVVGRPICEAADAGAAARRVLEQMRAGFERR